MTETSTGRPVLSRAAHPNIMKENPVNDDFTDADAKAVCAALGVNTRTITDAFGRTLTVIDEEGMRTLAAHSPNPARGLALVDQIMAAARDTHGSQQ